MRNLTTDIIISQNINYLKTFDDFLTFEICFIKFIRTGLYICFKTSIQSKYNWKKTIFAVVFPFLIQLFLNIIKVFALLLLNMSFMKQIMKLLSIYFICIL